MNSTQHVRMYDDVNVGLIPADAEYIAVYVDGTYENDMEVTRRFPHATLLRIDVRGGYRRGDVLDVEVGDATNGDAVGWFKAREGKTRTDKPILYTSAGNVAALRGTMARAGIKANRYYIWSAHYNHVAHICGNSEVGHGCTYPPADGTQWTDKSHGRSLDESLMSGYMMPRKGIAPPPAPPAPKPGSAAAYTQDAYDSAKKARSRVKKGSRRYWNLTRAINSARDALKSWGWFKRKK